MDTKTCRRCGETKSLDSFGQHKQRGVDRTRSYCRPCHADNSRESRQRNLEAARARELAYARAHIEQKRENARRWYYASEENRAKAIAREAAKYERDPEYKRDRAHQTRARRAGSPVVEFVRRREVYERDEGICHVCGGAVAWEDYDMDHVVPLSTSGEHSYANVKVSHSACNRARPKSI